MKGCGLLLLSLVTGCAGPLGALRVQTPVAFDGNRFTLRTDGSIPQDVARVQAALAKATAPLTRWGGLEAPVTVYVVSTHDDLEAAVHRRGYGWLRAWARYDEVIVQAPSTWTERDEVLNELVVHELTHCLLFQRSGTRESWRDKQIPLWFREGMAILTAKQAYLYPSLEDSALWLQRNPTFDPFADGEALSAEHASEVYGIALHAFAFLERRYGAPRLEALMATMREGAGFERAFDRAVGIAPAVFLKDFGNYLRLRAFRGSGRTVPLRRPDLRQLIEQPR